MPVPRRNTGFARDLTAHLGLAPVDSTRRSRFL